MSMLDPPFALDDDSGSIRTTNSARTSVSRGYRDGGPKKARLFRVALLSPQKNVDGLVPVKVSNIPRSQSPYRIESSLKKTIPNAADIYVPVDLKRNLPKQDFAILRFKDDQEAQDLLEKGYIDLNSDSESVTLSVKPLESQKILFSNGTGYMGLTNVAFDDGTRNFNEKVAIMQDIKFENVLSRNGAPWSSQRELKFLGKKMNKTAHEMYSIRITNLPSYATIEDVKEIFSRFGDVGEIFFPKPLHVQEYLKIKEENCGHGFVRFLDRRDMKAAYESIVNKQIVIDGHIIAGEERQPLLMPTDKTRRYY